MNRILFTLGIVAAVCLSSCSGDEYRDAIPQGSVALISVNAAKVGDKAKPVGSLLESVLAIDDIRDCGLGLMDNIYLFESADGNFGICAKVTDEGDLDDALQKAEQKGMAKSAGERQGCTFYNLGDSWVAGFTSGTLLIMGPVLSTDRPMLMQQMAGYLAQDGDNGFSKSRIMKEMDKHDGAMAMVVQLNALPEQEEIQGLLSLGAPKNADPSNLVISADVNLDNDMINIDGRLTSFNQSTAKSIEETYSRLRPITDKYATKISMDNVLTFLINSKGQDLLPMLQNNNGMMSSMAGINAVIDMNKILQSVDGDMMLDCSSFDKDKSGVDLACQIANDSFMKDIDYWKQSAPAGGVFTKDGEGWFYNNSNDKVNFHFGIDKKQFYCGTEAAKKIIDENKNELDAAVINAVKGKKMAFVVSPLRALEGSKYMFSFMTVRNQAKAIVYTIK